MSWRKLLDENALRPKKINQKEVDGILAKAHKLLRAASILTNEDIDEPAFKEAYDSMVLAPRALIFSLGYKPRTVGSHVITINFCELYFGLEMKALIDRFKKMKEKRNYLIYGAGLMISKTEAQNAIKGAVNFLEIIEAEIFKTRRQKKLI